MIGFGWVLWHINHCGLSNAKSSLYIYNKYIWFGLVGFYGISTIVSYLIPNLLYTYILDIYDWVGFYNISTIVGYLMPNPLNTYILNIHDWVWLGFMVCGVFNKLPDFFVLAFKIVVDSWKFTMLLLYILWDDRPIFMISGSNEQWQQQLEYTLLKPDCHSWWISKMQSGREDTLEEQYAIKFCFILGKNATETYGMLQTAFRASCMNRASDFECHKRFKEGRESVRDDERSGRVRKSEHHSWLAKRVRVRVTMLRF